MRFLRCCFALVVPFLLLTGCEKKAEREWSPSDHDHRDQPAEQPQRPQPTAKLQPPAASAAATDVGSVWSSTCSPCHGATGKGDGPAGRALRVPDMTARQAKMTDEQLTAVIKNGRGQMPAFGNFPPELVDDLVKKVRTMK